MKAVVVGGSGHIGARIARHLQARHLQESDHDVAAPLTGAGSAEVLSEARAALREGVDSEARRIGATHFEEWLARTLRRA